MRAFLILLILTLSSFAKESTILINEAFSDTTTLEQQYCVMDANDTLVIDDIRNERLPKIQQATTPATTKTHWIMFKLKNTSATKRTDLVLLHPRAGLDYIDLYIYKDDVLLQKRELGDMRPLSSHGITHRNSIELMTLEPLSTYTVITKLKSYGPYELWWSVESVHHFVTISSLKTLVWGIVGGVLLTLVLYNFVLYFPFREISYIIYCCYAISLLLFRYTYEGFDLSTLYETQK